MAKTYKNYWEAVDSAEYQAPAVYGYEEDKELSHPEDGDQVFISKDRKHGYEVYIYEEPGKEFTVVKRKLNEDDIREMEEEMQVKA